MVLVVVVEVELALVDVVVAVDVIMVVVELVVDVVGGKAQLALQQVGPSHGQQTHGIFGIMWPLNPEYILHCDSTS